MEEKEHLAWLKKKGFSFVDMSCTQCKNVWKEVFLNTVVRGSSKLQLCKDCSRKEGWRLAKLWEKIVKSNDPSKNKRIILNLMPKEQVALKSLWWTTVSDITLQNEEGGAILMSLEKKLFDKLGVWQ